MELVIPHLHTVWAGVGDIFSAIRPRNRIALGLHNRYEVIFTCRPRHRIFNGTDGFELPTVTLECGAVLSCRDGFSIKGLLEFGKHGERVFLAQAVTDTAHLFNRIRAVIKLHTACVADAVDDKMIVDSLPTVIVVSVKMCADKHLKAGKHFLGKPQTDPVCGVIIVDLSGCEGLFVMIIIHAASLAVEIFGCHKFIISGSTYAIDPRQIAVSVLVKCLGILRNITDDRPHRALILLLRFDIITCRHVRHLAFFLTDVQCAAHRELSRFALSILPNYN